MKNSLLDSQCVIYFSFNSIYVLLSLYFVRQKEKVSRLIDQNDLLIEMNLRKLRFTQKALEKLNI
jgi:hypothetical protein